MSTLITQSNSPIESLINLKSIDAPNFLSPNPELSQSTRKTSQEIFSFLKPYTPKCPFDQLFIDGFDVEQIWQQIDIQSQPLISSLKREINRFEKNPEKITSLFSNDEEIKEKTEKELDVFEKFDEEFDEDMNVGLDSEEDEDGVESESEEEEEEGNEEEEEEDEDDMPEVEDKFLKIKELEKFLVSEEKKEYGGEEKIKKKKKTVKSEDGDSENDFSESDDDMKEADANELLMYGGLDDDEDDAHIGYDDFYLPNKKVPKSKGKQVSKSDDWMMEDEESIVPKKRKRQVDDLVESDEQEFDDEDESQDDEDESQDDEDKSENGKTLSTHEKEREKLQAKIKQMEEANLAAKDWTMKGEVTASKRPRDSALEVDLDFEHNMRPPPVITEEVTTSLEDMIKKRISEGRFDDVQRAPKLPSTAPKEKKELDDNKSKKGLAEIYEDEYAKQTGLGAVPLSQNDELKKEASGLFKSLCLKLDALSHFHFAPKPVIEDMSIQTNVPALAMEEIAPVAVSDAAMLAPEEVFAGKGDIKEDTELTKEDRKRRRATKKRQFKAGNAARTENQIADKTTQNNAEGKEL